MTRSVNSDALVAEARKARQFSHSPYSRFSVGAAVLTANGRIFPGCNVENASYGLTVCAERVAILKAVSEGEREVVAIAISVHDRSHRSVAGYPCGACLQVLAEFAGPNAQVIIDGIGEMRLSELSPHPFQLKVNAKAAEV